MEPLSVILPAIAGALAAIGGLWKVISDAKSANNNTTSQATTTLILALREEVTTLRERQDRTDEQVDTQRKQINLVITDRDTMARYIWRVMVWIKSGSTPPQPPIPGHLRDAFKSAGVPWPDEDEDSGDTTQHLPIIPKED